MSSAQSLQEAVLGGGCFWCLEAVYHQLQGIKSVTSGFAGGITPHPTYEEVCTGTTGHAEVIRIEFDPSQVSYEKLLKLFWQAHDPSTQDRQGADIGTQYRSIILYANEVQRVAATQSCKEAQHHFTAPIVTQIVPLNVFYPAESFHQAYYRRHPKEPYTQGIIEPKLEKLRNKGALPKLNIP